MQIRASFHGTGGELFGKMFVGMLLCGITAGIYLPWFIVGLQRYISDNTVVHGTPRGDIRVQFTGTGGELFKIGFIGAILTGLTAGIYGFWLMAGITRFYTDHTAGTANDGTAYRLRFTGTGGQIFGALIVGAILCGITFGIYMPWYICRLSRLFADETQLLENEAEIGKFSFGGEGGELFGRYIVGFLLTMVTLGIYVFWFQVDMMKFFIGHSHVTVQGHTYTGDYTGVGSEWAVLMILGNILTALTLGIYMFWFLANQLRYQTEHTVYGASAPSGSGAALPVAQMA